MPDSNELTIDPVILNGTELLAPGVWGYSMETEVGMYIPFIAAVNEGNGDVGRYLDSLPTDRRVVVPTVISARLAGMLRRRGFHFDSERSEHETIPMYVRG